MPDRPNIRVFLDHQLIGEHPGKVDGIELWTAVAHELEDILPLGPEDHPDDLLVLHGRPRDWAHRQREKGEMEVVKRYAAGTWHDAGPGLICGYLVDDPNCPNCYKQP